MLNHARRRTAFTLIELLVVIAIIIIIATVSLVVLTKSGRGTDAAARITKAEFTRVRQLASSRRETTFLLFMNATDSASGLATGRMEIHRDGNKNGSYEPASDPIDGESIALSKGLVFRFQAPFANPQTASPAWLAFRPDGSIAAQGVFLSGDISASAFDAAFASGTMGTTADIVIEAANGAPGRVYLDVALPTGIVRKLVYFE